MGSSGDRLASVLANVSQPFWPAEPYRSSNRVVARVAFKDIASTMIPDFREDGYLPDGLHTATEAEVTFRFALPRHSIEIEL